MAGPPPMFAPAAAMTDTDAKEQGTLLTCWTNRRGQVLNLLETVRYEDALHLVTSQECGLSRIASQGAKGEKAAVAIKSFVQYLQGTWMPMEMLRSWAKKGQVDVAALMKIPLEKVVTTSNHLESFNGKLKKAHIPQWQHSGRRLRFDILIYHLVADIVPRIFARHCVTSAYEHWKTERFRAATGGADLHAMAGRVEASARSHTGMPAAGLIPRAWYPSDPRRDLHAQTLYDHRHLTPIEASCPYELWVTCKCGAACKHLCTFRLLIEGGSAAGLLEHRFLFPLTEAEAIDTENCNRRWYGDAYPSAVTSPTPQSMPAAESTITNATTAAMSSWTAPVQQHRPPCLLPPAHLNEALPTSLGLVLELEELQQDLPASSDVEDMSDGDVLNDNEDVGVAHLLQISTNNPPSPSSGLCAVHRQVQSQVETDVTFLLPRLHGLNSTLRGSRHMLTPTEDIYGAEAASPRMVGQEVYAALEPHTLHKTSNIWTETQQGALKRRELSPLPPSPEPMQKRKKSFKMS
ncbi:hypothetical protein GY45DRAFT_1340931 [Cubamyces sp. BRFM 1775]|nr:hypothetical protein GY45DRAFT_1340931 [Cubamyces sp. BRFM 1775]